jgi:N-acetylmuramoyl-L-alanine amidase
VARKDNNTSSRDDTATARRILPPLAFALAMCLLVVCFYNPGYSSLPPAEKRYDAAKTAAAALRANDARAGKRESWKKMAGEFSAIYEDAKDWRNRAAALFRAAECLDEMARHSFDANDAREAVACYESLGRKHPDSVLADDALFRAAALRAAWLKDDKGALELIQRLKIRYPKGDILPEALALEKTLSAAARGRTAPESRKVAAAEKKDVKEEQPPAAPPARSEKRSEKTIAAPITPRAESAPLPFARFIQPAAEVEKNEAVNVHAPQKPRLTRAELRQRRLGNMADQLGLTVGTVFIDAGHGGRDPGTSHHGILERVITLDVALALGKLLEQNGLSVVYSRTRDVSVSLSDRACKANSAHADLFVSIHVNANEDASVSGFETYYLDLASNDHEARVAARENVGSDRRLGDMRDLLADVMLSNRVEESRRLAVDIQQTMLSFLKQKKFRQKNSGAKAAPFHVLIGAGMPAVLAELGYCTNTAEARNLADPQYRRILAEGLAWGILAYKNRLLNNRIAENALTPDSPGAK